jgi:hypothetical protein
VDLPLLLAGPILRRVEPTLVAVWVALRDPATVTLSLWEGRVTAGSGSVFLSSEPPGTKTLRVGKQLHIALAVIKIPKTSPRVLQPGRAYSYDLSIKTATETTTLQALGLLTTGQLFGKQVEPLGFDENFLPSFALPPQELTDLRVIFGSCRGVNNPHLDAMVWIDDLMRDNTAYSYKDPLKRPHQLFLGGDQIYADDVDPVHMRVLIDLGKTLIGTKPSGEALERLMVDSVRRKKPNVATPTSFDDYDPEVTRKESPTTPNDFLLPADHPCFPAGRRLLLSMVDAKMTSKDGDSHLFSLGDFAAMYLSVWSDACWPRTALTPTTSALDLPADDKFMSASLTWPAIVPTFLGAPLDGRESRDFENELSPFQNYEAYLEPRTNDTRRPEQQAKDYSDYVACVHKRLALVRNRLTVFESGLGKVRRVLANIPTFMMFDDHDFTDDWNLNPIWYDRVYTTSLGVNAARNALVSYALFQDWGNDPLKYEKDDYKRLLADIEKLFPADTPGPDQAAADDIDTLLGFKLRGVVDPDGSVSAVNPIITWHFSVPGPQHLAVALDNRTRRSFPSRNGPPGNVAGSLDRTAHTVQTEQMPAGPFTDGKKVLLVIAPLQVLGAPILDELVAPAAYRAFDVKDYNKILQPGLRTGTQGMPGTNPDAIEAWAFDAKTLEALLRRLEPYRQVVLLSGDVHYSAGTVMSYWTKGNNVPARIVQFTSSGFKNVMPSYITTVDKSLSIAHQIVRAKIGAERLGWDVKPLNPIVLPAGKSEKDIPRALRAKLRTQPTLLPTYGWPKGSVINPTQLPDWSWRVEPIFDVRADAARPPAIQPLAIDATANATLDVPNAPHAIDGYHAAAARHQRAVRTLRNSRQILFRSNFGVVRFEQRPSTIPGSGPTVLHAIYEVYTAAKVPEDVGTAPLKPELFMLHVAALEAPQEIRPEQLSLQPVNADSPRVTTSVQV